MCKHFLQIVGLMGGGWWPFGPLFCFLNANKNRLRGGATARADLELSPNVVEYCVLSLNRDGLGFWGVRVGYEHRSGVGLIWAGLKDCN